MAIVNSVSSEFLSTDNILTLLCHYALIVSCPLYCFYFILFVAVFLGCTSTGRVGLCFLWFYVQELPKAQPAVVLVLKRLRRRGNGLKSHPTDWEKPGIEPATPGLQDIGLSPTPRLLLFYSLIRFEMMLFRQVKYVL